LHECGLPGLFPVATCLRRTATGQTTGNVTLQDLNTRFVLEFLVQLEKDRQNSIRARNARLAAIRAFTHEVSVRGHSLRCMETAMQRMQRCRAISLALIPDGEPMVLEIVVAEVKAAQADRRS